MIKRRLLAIVARVVLSILLAGIFYTGWMAIAIPTIKAGFGGLIIKVMLWILAPIITGFGFALGLRIFDLISSGTNKSSFGATYEWCLVGCAIGGGIFCLFGPMLIVFGMFLAGTLSVAAHELIVKGNRKKA